MSPSTSQSGPLETRSRMLRILATLLLFGLAPAAAMPSARASASGRVVWSPPLDGVIANSDFEQGFTLAGGGYIANSWAEWEANRGAITGYDETIAVHGGAHSQRLRVWNSGGGSGGVYQQVLVTSGASYTVSVQTLAYDTLSYCSLGVNPAGGTDPSSGVIWSSGSNSLSWIQQTWTGTATSNSITIYLRAASLEGSKRNCYFDDVTLVLGPPPPGVVANPDFEQGFALSGGGYIANYWAEWEANRGAITGYDETLAVHGGAHSQRLRVWNTGGGSGGVYQQVPVASGASYTVSVQTLAYDTLSYCSLGISPAGGTDPTSGVIWSPGSNSLSWTQQTWAGTATSNSITIYFRAASVDSAKRNCYFDDLTLVSGAEPTQTSTPTATATEPPMATPTDVPPATATEPPAVTATQLPTVPPPEPPAGYTHRYWVLPDWLSPHWGYQPRPVAPAPAVNRTGEINNSTYFRRARLTEEWQWFWVDLLSLSEYQRVYADLTSEERVFIIRAFGSLTHDHLAFTNNAGSATRNCYPCGQTDRGEDMRIDPLICGGNTVLGSDPILNERGEWMVRLYSFNANEHPPVATLEMLDDPRVLWATIITNRRLPDGSYMLYWFPQLRDGTSVPYPYLTVEPYYYPLEELEEYPLTDPRRPIYNLP